MESQRRFSIAYALSEIGLVAIGLAAGRLVVLPTSVGIEVQAMCFCIAMTAGCAALGGLFFRMALGFIAGGVFSVASIPLIWMGLSLGHAVAERC